MILHNTQSFNFTNDTSTQKLNLKLPFVEHFEELKQRSIHLMLFFILCSSLAFFDLNPIVEFLEMPAKNIKFFQPAPGDYFLETIKIAVYIGLIGSIIPSLSQFLLFIIPGLTPQEQKWVLPLILGSTFLFFISLIFSYICLVPAALNFFLLYNQNIIEPLWSFSQYCDFILIIFYTTGIAFQIPILQVFLGVRGIISVTQMIELWRYVILVAFIVSAVLTPSTDPITQIFLSGAILGLYLLGVSILKFLKYE
jgi:sec-independent protein translocase protein TatC|nr:Sec-independent protein translocase component TatC [Meringosphaera mediterranea]WLD06299.1 Sec-independent protein translocase component TatC [Meringosphaera mediterranea]